YYYVVQATNSGGGFSANSTQVSASTSGVGPAVPASLTVTTVTGTSVSLSWPSSSGATSYRVLRSATSGTGYALVGSPAGTSFTNSGLANGTTYFYVVQAVNASGTSAISPEASATTAPPAPTGLTATLSGSTSINLAWTASAGATGYRILRSTTS